MSELQLFDLSGKQALVTGAANGIGRACALAMAGAGANVAIIDLNEESGNRTVDDIKKMGRRSVFIRCDVTNEMQVSDMLSHVVSEFGSLDIAVNNAGTFIRGDDESQSKEEWEKVINVNLTGVWLCAKAEMQQFIKQTPCQGKIINIASIGAHNACSNGAYDASKAAVMHLSKTLAARWGKYNINVNTISPSYVSEVFGKVRSQEERKKIRSLIPLGHVQRLKDLYGPVIFLASESSNYVTGQDVLVDGGHILGTWLTPFDRDCPPRISEHEEVE